MSPKGCLVECVELLLFELVELQLSCLSAKNLSVAPGQCLSFASGSEEEAAGFTDATEFAKDAEEAAFLILWYCFPRPVVPLS